MKKRQRRPILTQNLFTSFVSGYIWKSNHISSDLCCYFLFLDLIRNLVKILLFQLRLSVQWFQISPNKYMSPFESLKEMPRKQKKSFPQLFPSMPFWPFTHSSQVNKLRLALIQIHLLSAKEPPDINAFCAGVKSVLKE